MVSTKNDAANVNADDADNTPLKPAEKKALDKYEAVIEKNMAGFVAVGKALKDICERRLYRETHDKFDEYCSDRWEFAHRRAYQLISAAKAVGNVHNCAQIAPAREAHVRPLIGLKPEKQVEVWEAANAAAQAKGGRITAGLVTDTRDRLLEKDEAIGQFNRTNEHINWAKWSWNPVTGCEHGCEYCYAKGTRRLGVPEFGGWFPLSRSRVLLH